jgi:hypothetical protein
VAATLRNSVPRPIRRLAREIGRRPPAGASGRAARLAARRILDAQSRDASRHGLPVVDDLDPVERLFADSERNFADIVAPYVPEFRWSLGEIYNEFFESVDAELYYAVVRRLRPRLIIEVGSGNSTSFARDATKANGIGRIISIDPEPRTALPDGVEHLASRVEDVDPALFAELAADDVLFIDSSHTTEEARFHTERILPFLSPGVVVHHHDILLPYVRYYMDDPSAFGEPDVLLDFYLRHRDRYRVLVSASYVRYRDPDLLARLIGSYRWHRARVPGSLWTTRLDGDRP